MKGNSIQLRSDGAEGVEVPLAPAAPVCKLRAQAESPERPSHQIALIDTEQAVQAVKRGERHLAPGPAVGRRRVDDAHGAEVRLQTAYQRSGGQPSGRSATEDGDAADGLRGH